MDRDSLDSLLAKEEALRDVLAGVDAIVVAYSGGVDSSYLAHAAHEVLGDRALAATAVSPSLARAERDGAAALARARGWNHAMVETGELRRAEYRRNGSDRCYWCKAELFDVLTPLAARRGAVIAIGTNVDDLGDHRPGADAARERNVLTPLLDSGLTKADVRRLSRRAGLPSADKPAGPCLASRVAYGVEVTAERLTRIDDAEAALRSLGFAEFRVRDHGELARIEVPPGEIARAAAARAEISARLKALGFTYVTLDLEGFRSGSLNDLLPAASLRIARPGG
ncbi:MAG TPA: ATP-dependent sacrificial sulfur transferase LarE [Actinomycetota bacterium]|nr:ATP-dependent sacrificial sulfur transferase LarE [Actinomycetota bacterium]